MLINYNKMVDENLTVITINSTVKFNYIEVINKDLAVISDYKAVIIETLAMIFDYKEVVVEDIAVFLDGLRWFLVIHFSIWF